jgi:hypothetical protein
MNSAFATSSRPNADAKDSAHDDAHVERERFQEPIPRRVAAGHQLRDVANADRPDSGPSAEKPYTLLRLGYHLWIPWFRLY